jgi:hypothetical protein
MKRYEPRFTQGNLLVPVIAVFTKRDQFRREVKMKLEDQRGSEVDQALFDREMEEIFNKYYLANLGEAPRFVCLESEDFINQLASITLIFFPCRNEQAWPRVYSPP